MPSRRRQQYAFAQYFFGGNLSRLRRALLAAALIPWAGMADAWSQSIEVDSEAGLNSVISDVFNISPNGPDVVVQLTGNITLTAMAQIIGGPLATSAYSTRTLTIDGGGLYSITMDAGVQDRIFFLQSGALSLAGVTLQGGTAQGGNGGSVAGGGGGMGAGGAIFVSQFGSLSLSNVNLKANAAQGGNGGNGTSFQQGNYQYAGGGGGGMGGNGGNAASVNTGGGGGGFGAGANGGTGGLDEGGSGGGTNGGSGGNSITGDNGEPGGPGGGGGGAGGITWYAYGGAGGFGGGGGGGNSAPDAYSGAGGYGGGGGAGYNGSMAGFGGGAGSYYYYEHPSAAGYGGGASGASETDAGGIDYISGGAGGGAGYGGAIFVQSGGQIFVNGGLTFEGNSVAGGQGGSGGASDNGGGDGQADGQAIFLQGSSNLTFAVAAGQTEELTEEIAIDSNNSNPDDPQTNPVGSSNLVKTGAGTLLLNTNVTVTVTMLEQGALTLSAGNTLRSDVIVAAGATFGGDGTVNGAVHFTDDAPNYLETGASGNPLTLGTLSLGAETVSFFHLGPQPGDVSSPYLVIQDAVNLDGVFSIVGEDGFEVGTYALLQFNGPLSSFVDNGIVLQSPIEGFSGDLSFDLMTNQMILTVSAVPEPAPFGLAVGAFIVFFFVRRRVFAKRADL